MNGSIYDKKFNPQRHALRQVFNFSIGVTLIAFFISWQFFQAAINQQTQRLVEIVQTRAGLIRAMADYAKNEKIISSENMIRQSTLIQLQAAQASFPGFGKTGEFTLAHKVDDDIVFLLRHRHGNMDTPAPVPMNHSLAEPMRRALSGKAGTIRGMDYRGEIVLAAFLPITELGWGIVAKIDLAEVRAPYIRAGITGAVLAILIISIGAFLGLRSMRPFTDALERSEARYRLLVENQNDLVVSFDSKMKFTFVSKNYCETFGSTQEELISGTFFPLVHEEDLPKVKQSLKKLFSPPYQISHEERSLTKDGWRWFQWSDRALVDNKGNVLEVIAVGRDITDRKWIELERTKALKLLGQHSVVFENALEAIIIADDNGNILFVNKAFCRITGYDADEVAGRDPSIIKSDRHGFNFYKDLFCTLKSDGSWRGETWNRRKNGEIFPAWETITLVDNSEIENCDELSYISIFSDISERKMNEERIRWLANHDGLTKLPNRMLFEERCQHALTHARRNGTGVALLFIDLDRFKPVNDELGHAAGDQLLIKVARRLKKLVRESDTVARIGGDEFTIVMEELSHHDGVEKVAKKLLSELARPFNIMGNSIQIGGSVGISIYPENGSNWEELVKKADAAMYMAKNMGRGSYVFYCDSENKAGNQMTARI